MAARTGQSAHNSCVPQTPASSPFLAAQQVAHLGRHGLRCGSRRGAIVGLQNVEIGVDQQQVGGYVAEYAVVDPVACSDVPALVADTDGQEDAKRRQHPCSYYV